MFERLHTPDDALNWQLGAALKMEREIVDMLEDLVEESEGAELKDAFRAHQSETREHVARIEQAFAACGWEADDSPCPAIEAIEKEGKANIKKSDESIQDAVIVGGAIQTEHHEIAVYEYLIAVARSTGHDDVAVLLERNCEEERHALEKVRGLTDTVLARTRERASA